MKAKRENNKAIGRAQSSDGDVGGKGKTRCRGIPPWFVSFGLHLVMGVVLSLFVMGVRVTSSYPGFFVRTFTDEVACGEPECEMLSDADAVFEATVAVERPISVPATLSQSCLVETDNSMDMNSAFGDPTCQSNLPSFNRGVVGTRGFGGGGGGCYGMRMGGGSRSIMIGGGGAAPAEVKGVQPGPVQWGLSWLHENRTLSGGGCYWDCRAHGGAEGEENDIGVTGLALLAFLNNGITEEESPNEYHLSVRGALDWFSARQAADGSFSENNYANGIASVGVIEAFATGSTARGAAARRAVGSIISRQLPGGGWNYGDRMQGRNRNDTSITSWQVMALNAAMAAGIEVPDTVTDRARAFFVSAGARPGGGQVAYAMEGDRIERGTSACQAMAMLSLLFLGNDANDPFVNRCAEYLEAITPGINGEDADLYYLYYGSMAMFRMGGRLWRSWDTSLRGPLCALQVRDLSPNHGSWNPEGKVYGEEGGRVYATAMSCLTLELYHRYLKFQGPEEIAGAELPAAVVAVPAAAEPVPDAPVRVVEIPPDFKRTQGEDLQSTFSVDVDTAAYTIVRGCLDGGILPAAAAVRVEEFINYFPYDYPGPTGKEPFAVSLEAGTCPWNGEHRLVRIGIRGRDVERERKPANLVFLIDVSGSMDSADKLPLLTRSLKKIVPQLKKDDRVAIVVYAGNSGLVLPSTSGDRRAEIAAAIDRLSAGGSTHGSAGINLAYETAAANFIRGGINRVVLATDGDFNVGVTDIAALEALIKEKANLPGAPIHLSVLGFGAGCNDGIMETLADRGNGNYAFIDSDRESDKVLVEQLASTLVTIAKDVKVQVEFDPAEVLAYRLLGYENRALANRDFVDDTKDAGEIGAGHRVTAFYEVVPASSTARDRRLLLVRLRYKEPDGAQSRGVIDVPLVDRGTDIGGATPDFRFAASVAAFGLILAGDRYLDDFSYNEVLALGRDAVEADEGGYRAEFVGLVEKAKALGRPQTQDHGLAVTP